MASNDTYQHVNHFKELVNIDNKVSEMDAQLDIVFNEIKKLVALGEELERHSIDYRHLWSKQNTDKYQRILNKCTQIDMSLEKVHK